MKQLRIIVLKKERSKDMDTVPDGNNKRILNIRISFAPKMNR